MPAVRQSRRKSDTVMAAASRTSTVSLPFRSAYKVVGSLVAYLIGQGKTLETASLEEYKQFSPAFDGDVYAAIDLGNCVNRRSCLGATSPKQVRAQIDSVRAALQRG